MHNKFIKSQCIRVSSGVPAPRIPTSRTNAHRNQMEEIAPYHHPIPMEHGTLTLANQATFDFEPLNMSLPCKPHLCKKVLDNFWTCYPTKSSLLSKQANPKIL